MRTVPTPKRVRNLSASGVSGDSLSLTREQSRQAAKVLDALAMLWPSSSPVYAYLRSIAAHFTIGRSFADSEREARRRYDECARRNSLSPQERRDATLDLVLTLSERDHAKATGQAMTPAERATERERLSHLVPEVSA